MVTESYLDHLYLWTSQQMTTKSHGETEVAVSEARYVAATGCQKIWRFGNTEFSSANTAD
jgi:hypothetical protein